MSDMHNAPHTGILEVTDLCKTYRDGEVLAEVLKGISFSVAPGEFVAIQGSSGAGKSTLLNPLGALDKPDSGRIVVDGLELTSDIKNERVERFRRDKVGFIFQNHYLMQEFTVLENVMLPLRVQGYNTTDTSGALASWPRLGCAALTRDGYHTTGRQTTAGSAARDRVSR